MPDAAMLSRLHPAGFVEPCLPTPARTVPTGPQWAHEIKHDGFRFIVRRDGDRVRVFSRTGRDWSDKVPAIVEAMLALPVQSATIDGEGVVVDDRGITDFEKLFAALARRGGTRAAFLYAFDVIEVDGDDVRDRRWEVRRATLTKILRKAPYDSTRSKVTMLRVIPLSAQFGMTRHGVNTCVRSSVDADVFSLRHFCAGRVWERHPRRPSGQWPQYGRLHDDFRSKPCLSYGAQDCRLQAGPRRTSTAESSAAFNEGARQ